MAQRLSSAREYIDGVLHRDRVLLARAITLIESDREAHAGLAAEILEALLPYSGKAYRIGITGIPGGGKSTFIEAFGGYLIRECGRTIAVLSVDPSSPISGGSILGDKTRMEKLSLEEQAFVRPSPARGHPGGVGRRTREAVLLCEAAGYQNIFVETVGVGQSETAVRSMTDFFLLISVAGAGDELQGIKRGILELIDALAISKADGENEASAERASAEYRNALRLLPRGEGGWQAGALAISSLTGKGVQELWEMILRHRAQMEENGYFLERRKRQSLDWMHELIALGLQDLLRADRGVLAILPSLQSAVRNGQITAEAAAGQVLTRFLNK